MSTEIAKYILWILLCLPLVLLGIHLLGRLFSDTYAVNKKKIERKKAKDEEDENRRRFEEGYRKSRGERYN